MISKASHSALQNYIPNWGKITLTKLGYLIYAEESAKYSLGTATLSLGSAMLSRLDIRRLAHPLMQQLAEFGQ
jgi:DNA-binding IclR family transcriptional regulator